MHNKQNAVFLKQCLYNRLNNFVRYGSSTTHGVLDILNKIQTNTEKKLFSCAIFIDLKKAFETVNHVVLKKLCFYGIRAVTNSCFESNLSKSTKVTVMNDCIS